MMTITKTEAKILNSTWSPAFLGWQYPIEWKQLSDGTNVGSTPLDDESPLFIYGRINERGPDWVVRVFGTDIKIYGTNLRKAVREAEKKALAVYRILKELGVNSHERSTRI